MSKKKREPLYAWRDEYGDVLLCVGEPDLFDAYPGPELAEDHDVCPEGFSRVFGFLPRGKGLYRVTLTVKAERISTTDQYVTKKLIEEGSA